MGSSRFELQLLRNCSNCLIGTLLVWSQVSIECKPCLQVQVCNYGEINTVKTGESVSGSSCTLSEARVNGQT